MDTKFRSNSGCWTTSWKMRALWYVWLIFECHMKKKYGSTLETICVQMDTKFQSKTRSHGVVRFWGEVITSSRSTQRDAFTLPVYTSYRIGALPCHWQTTKKLLKGFVLTWYTDGKTHFKFSYFSRITPFMHIWNRYVNKWWKPFIL